MEPGAVGARRGWGPDLEKVRAPRVGRRRRGAQIFALLCPSLAFHIRSFSLWGSSRGILVVFLQGFHTTDREPKRARLGGPSLQKNTIKIQREDSQREKKIENGSGTGKKERKFGRSGGGGPAKETKKKKLKI